MTLISVVHSTLLLTYFHSQVEQGNPNGGPPHAPWWACQARRFRGNQGRHQVLLCLNLFSSFQLGTSIAYTSTARNNHKQPDFTKSTRTTKPVYSFCHCFYCIQRYPDATWESNWIWIDVMPQYTLWLMSHRLDVESIEPLPAKVVSYVSDHSMRSRAILQV